MMTARKLSFAFMALFLSWHGMVAAQSMTGQPGGPIKPPHSGMPNLENTGAFEGEVFTLDKAGQKVPVAQQEVVMIIFNNDQQVLVLKKNSDEKGQFSFKNIFRDPAYSYGFGTMSEEGLFVHPRVNLGEKEDVKKIAFQIGENSPYKRDPSTMGMESSGSPSSGSMSGGAPMGGGMPPQGEKHDHAEHDSSFGRPYQIIALSLSLLVVVVAVFFAARSRE